MKKILEKKVFVALKALNIEGVEPMIEFLADLARGDFATNVAMVVAPYKASPTYLVSLTMARKTFLLHLKECEFRYNHRGRILEELRGFIKP